MEKLYIILHSELDPGFMLPQCGHALQAFNDQHPDSVKAWEGNLIVLAAKNREELAALATELGRQHLIACFHEPDIGGALTAISVAGTAERQLSSLPVALKGVKRSKLRAVA